MKLNQITQGYYSKQRGSAAPHDAINMFKAQVKSMTMENSIMALKNQINKNKNVEGKLTKGNLVKSHHQLFAVNKSNTAQY